MLFNMCHKEFYIKKKNINKRPLRVIKIKVQARAKSYVIENSKVFKAIFLNNPISIFIYVNIVFNVHFIQ